ncbi:hypothetical protein ACFOD4_07040 [Pseudoroseomonas globiformis]|uniref:Uncharacterized protein n=1 Tax=Teichococcus globiformis TaxID=2307229 RepID=A0ABV7G3G1_9PROT
MILLKRLALPWLVVVSLASCSGPDQDLDLSGAHGTTIQSIRGEAPAAAPLRPETGNIWDQGLTPSASRP